MRKDEGKNKLCGKEEEEKVTLGKNSIELFFGTYRLCCRFKGNDS
jgi:hypothetical protein